MKAVATILLIVVALFGAYTWLVGSYFFHAEQAGQFGDMYGGLNALFSGLALAAVAFSIFQQNESIKLQRKEMQDTLGAMRSERSASEVFRYIEAVEVGLKDLTHHRAGSPKGVWACKCYLSDLADLVTKQSDLATSIGKAVGGQQLKQREVDDGLRSLYGSFLVGRSGSVAVPMMEALVSLLRAMDSSSEEINQIQVEFAIGRVPMELLTLTFHHVVLGGGGTDVGVLFQEFSLDRRVDPKLGLFEKPERVLENFVEGRPLLS